MGNSASRDEQSIGHAEKQRKALELRKAGATFDQIAEELKFANRSAAWKIVKSAIADITKEPAKDVLALELERLDAMLLGCWVKAKSGDSHAIDRVLRIMDRRAAYLGLDQPKGLKIEMARELEGFLGKLRENFDDDVYERILALLAGEYGGEASSPIPDGEGEEASDGGGESGEAPAAPTTGE